MHAHEGGGGQLARGEVVCPQCRWLYNKCPRVMAGRAEFEARDFSTGPLTSCEDAIPLNATYTTGRSVKDRETGKEIALGCNLTVGGGAFSDKPE